MTLPEDVEKVRQGIMRFRELLDIMRMRVEQGEKEYERLFPDGLPEEMREKDRQTQAAYALVNNRKPLENAVLNMHFHARDLERAFEEIHHRIVE
jgi:hypothetical protein